MPMGTLVTVLLLPRAHCDAHGALIFALHVPITGVVFASASAMSWRPGPTPEFSAEVQISHENEVSYDLFQQGFTNILATPHI